MRRLLGVACEKGELSVPTFLRQAVLGGEGPKGSDKASKEVHRLLGREQAAWLSSTAAGRPPTPCWQDFFFEREAGELELQAQSKPAPVLSTLLCKYRSIGPIPPPAGLRGEAQSEDIRKQTLRAMLGPLC